MRSFACRFTNTCHAGHSELAASAAGCLQVDAHAAVAHLSEEKRQQQVLQFPCGHVVRLLVAGKQAQLAHGLRRPAQGGHPVRQVGLVQRRRKGVLSGNKSPLQRATSVDTPPRPRAFRWCVPVRWCPPARRDGWRLPGRRAWAAASPAGPARRRRRTLCPGRRALTRCRRCHPPCASLSSPRVGLALRRVATTKVAREGARFHVDSSAMRFTHIFFRLAPGGGASSSSSSPSSAKSSSSSSSGGGYAAWASAGAPSC